MKKLLALVVGIYIFSSVAMAASYLKAYDHTSSDSKISAPLRYITYNYDTENFDVEEFYNQRISAIMVTTELIDEETFDYNMTLTITGEHGNYETQLYSKGSCFVSLSSQVANCKSDRNEKMELSLVGKQMSVKFNTDFKFLAPVVDSTHMAIVISKSLDAYLNLIQ